MIRVRLDDRALQAGLQQCKRQITIEANRELRQVVRSTTLPTARNIAPRKSGRLAGAMRAGVAGNRAYIENKTPYAGIVEYGGFRRDVIRPRSAKALSTPMGARAAITSPRFYKGRHKMWRAIDLTSEEVLRAQLDAIANAVATACGGTVGS